MKGVYLGIFATLWTLVCQCTSGCQDGGDANAGRITYSRELLLALRPPATGADFLHTPCSPWRTFNATVSGSVSRKRRRKRGRRGGVQRRLRRSGLGDRRRLPPLPTVLLSNVQSIRNKMDELEIYARWKREFRETCLLAFTETWLGERDRNEDLHITGFGPPIRLDRSPVITNKSKGGGVCFYINESTVRLSWCGREYVPLILNFCVSHFVPSTCRGSSLSCSFPLFTFTRELTSRQPVS